MTQQKPSAVTPERYVSGFTFKDYIAQVKVNKDQFEKYYGTALISSEDRDFLRKAAQGDNGVGKILVLGEDWCPDVFRGLPVIARIAEAAGIDLRIFPRDQNLDIMNEFLNQGQFMSLPTVVFYTRSQRDVAHWIERPKVANEEMAKLREEISKSMPNASEQEVRTASRDRMQARYPAWQQATVQEIRQLLAEKLRL